MLGQGQRIRGSCAYCVLEDTILVAFVSSMGCVLVSSDMDTEGQWRKEHRLLRFETDSRSLSV